MAIEAGELRRKAEACRRLAALGETGEHRAAWLRRADKWERLAVDATERACASARKRRYRNKNWQFAAVSRSNPLDIVRAKPRTLTAKMTANPKPSV